MTRLYSSLFVSYSDSDFEESVSLFQKRHELWGVDLAWFRGKRCLDAGCGGGRYLVALNRLGADAEGVDIDEGNVILANRRLAARGYPEKAKVASVLRLPYPEETFDYVVCAGVAHHTKDPRRAIAECFRVLKGGAVLCRPLRSRRSPVARKRPIPLHRLQNHSL